MTPQPMPRDIPAHLSLLLRWDVEQRCLPRRSTAPFCQWGGIFTSPVLDISNSACVALSRMHELPRPLLLCSPCR